MMSVFSLKTREGEGGGSVGTLRHWEKRNTDITGRCNRIPSIMLCENYGC